MTQTPAPTTRPRPADLALVVLVFVVARIVNGWAMVGSGARLAPTGGPVERYLAAVTAWDANWYAGIAGHGYPRVLPVVDGVTQWSEWPFMPLFPLAVKGVMTVTGLSFGVVAALLNPVIALAGVVLLFRLLAATSSRFVALASAVVLCAFPSSAVFQIGYAESLAFALLAWLLWLLHRHRHAAAAAVALLLVLTRPLALPVAALLAVHVWRDRRPARHVVREPADHTVDQAPAPLGWLVATIPVLLLVWPVVAWIGTGDPLAYPRAISGWKGFRDSPGGWLGVVIGHPSVVGIGVLAALVLTWLAALRAARGVAWGADLRTWSLVYGGFLLVASGAQTAVLRYLLLLLVPFWPLPSMAAANGRRDTWFRAAVLMVLVAGCLLLGMRWVDLLLVPQHPGAPQGYP